MTKYYCAKNLGTLVSCVHEPFLFSSTDRGGFFTRDELISFEERGREKLGLGMKIKTKAM